MAKQEYRSAVRSRNLIGKAFLELLEEKEFEKITVTDIVRRADINRSTFYAHYPDVRGLVEDIIEDALNRTMSLMEEIEVRTMFRDPLPFLRQLSKPLVENQQLYRLLLRTGQATIQLEKLKERLIQATYAYLDLSETVPDSHFFQIRIRFSIGGMIDVCVQWLRGELDCTVDEIIEHLAGILLRSAKDAEVQNWLN